MATEHFEDNRTPLSLQPAFTGRRVGMIDPAILAALASLAFGEARMTDLVLGIDVGLSNALALPDRSSALIAVDEMPTPRNGAARRTTANAPLLADIPARGHATQCLVEVVDARPGEGAGGAVAFGRSRRVVDGSCGALAICVTFITLPASKRASSLPPARDGANDAAMSEAIRYWPDKAAVFARVEDNGRAEAALTGVAGLTREARV